MRLFILTKTNSAGDITNYIDRSHGEISVKNYNEYPASYHRVVQSNLTQLKRAIGLQIGRVKHNRLEEFFDTLIEHIRVMDLNGKNTLTKEEIKSIDKYVTKKKNEHKINENRKYVVKFGDGTYMNTSYSEYYCFYSDAGAIFQTKHSLTGIKSGLTRTIREYGKPSSDVHDWNRKRFEEKKEGFLPKMKGMKLFELVGSSLGPVDKDAQTQFDEYVKEIDNRIFAASIGTIKA